MTASLNQYPARVNLGAVQGSPFTVVLNITITDSMGDPVAWSQVTDPTAVVVSALGNPIPDMDPIVTSPTSGQLQLVWSTEQTGTFYRSGASWGLSMTISGVGPLGVVAGYFVTVAPETPGGSTSSSGTITVSVGTATVNVSVTLEGGGGGLGDVTLTGTPTTGQVPTATSPTTADWQTPAAGGVTSFNTRDGAVTLSKSDVTDTGLTYSDVDADVSGAAATAQSNAESFATTAASTAQSNAETYAAAQAAAAQAAAEAASDPAGSAATAQSNAESFATGAVATEATARASADATNAAAISAETTRAEGAESTNAGAIATETTRAETAEALLAPLASAALTGSPTAPTKSPLTENTDIATTAYTDLAVAVETTRAEAAEALKLAKASNLSDVADAGTSRANLHVALLSAAAAVAVTNVTSLTTSTSAIDGYALASGDIVLLTGQTTASQNGPWLVPASGSWTRPTDFTSGAVVHGRGCQVMNGTLFANTVWYLSTPTAGITVDSSSQTWTVDRLAITFLSTTNNVVLPKGTYKISPVSGGAAGGGAAAGNSNYTFSLTASAVDNTNKSLNFGTAAWGLSDTVPFSGMVVTGAGITGLVLVEYVAGTIVKLVDDGGSIGTLTTSAYTFTWPNSGGGGATGTPCTVVGTSDGVTPFDFVVGAGGLGAPGATGNPGGNTYVTGGPDSWSFGTTAPWAPYGNGGLAATSSQVGLAGMPSGVTLPTWPYAALNYTGAGGCLTFPFEDPGVAAAEMPNGSVGGGAGAANNGTDGGNGGQAGTLVGAGGPGTGNTGTTTGGTGGSAAANSGCAGGGGGGSYTGGSAVTGGAGGSGYITAEKSN